MASILDGIRMVEVATFVAGPAAGTVMADFGAEVIHVEPPDIGDPYRYLYTLNPLPSSEHNYPWLLDSRNKRSLALDLKSEPGREALYRLVRDADVFLTNYHPSVLEALHVRYEDLKPLNERLIYAHVTGYGEVGEEAEKPGYDATAWWARSGMMDLIRPKGGEVAMSAPGMGDHPTSVTLFGAIMMALYNRERTGVGTKVSTSLLANGAWANGILAQAALCGTRSFKPFTHAESPNPLVSVYQTKDGRLFFLVMVKEASEWGLFCKAVDRPDLLEDPRFKESADRRENAGVLVAILDQLFAQKTLAEWTEILDRHRITFGLVQRSDELPHDPQMRTNGVFREIEETGGMETIDSPIRMEGADKRAPTRAPEIGQHTAEVLQGIGYTETQIRDMVEAGVARIAKE